MTDLSLNNTHWPVPLIQCLANDENLSCLISKLTSSSLERINNATLLEMHTSNSKVLLSLLASASFRFLKNVVSLMFKV